MNHTYVDAETLFRELKREAETYRGTWSQRPGSIAIIVSDISQAMSKYDLDIFLEILSLDRVESDHRIDRHELEDFTLKIEQYMDAQAPGQEQLKKYVRIISTYLVFIAKRPLHSPDIAFFGS